MGFLDKAKQSLQEGAKAAQEKLDDVSAKRKADGLLRELGAWTFAKHKGGYGEADDHIARVIAELEAHEAEHGPLGGSGDDVPGAAPAAPPPPPTAPPSEPAMEATPPPPPPSATAPPDVPGSTAPPPSP